LGAELLGLHECTAGEVLPRNSQRNPR
jgi:hypothetical protein